MKNQDIYCASKDQQVPKTKGDGRENLVETDSTTTRADTGCIDTHEIYKASFEVTLERKDKFWEREERERERATNKFHIYRGGAHTS